MIGEGSSKIIDKKYAVEVKKDRLGGGAYGDVFRAYRLDEPQIKLACKVLSKQKILQKI